MVELRAHSSGLRRGGPTVGLCAALNVLDGYDILSMAYIGPAIRREMMLDATGLGVLLGSGIAGMTIGALGIAMLADRVGRRPVVIASLMLGIIGMVGTALAPTYAAMLLARLLTGLGVGGMMPTINTLAAESVDRRNRGLAVSLQATGYPIGGVLGGAVAAALLADHGWRYVTGIGAAIGLILLLAVVTTLPDTPWRRADKQQSRWLDRTALTFAATIFLTQLSFYFFLSWMPGLLSAARLTDRVGLSGAMLVNLGGIIADLCFAGACLAVSPRRLGIATMVGGFVAVAVLVTSPLWSAFVCFAIGACLFAAMASLYAVAPSLFPTDARAGGTGFGFGVGRIGGVLGPVAGGILFDGTPGGPYVLVMAIPLIAAAAMLWSIGNHRMVHI